MKALEILRRTEEGISLFTASIEDLIVAKKTATRKIHHIEIDSEIKKRKQIHKTYRIDGFVRTRPPLKGNRCPTKRELR